MDERHDVVVVTGRTLEEVVDGKVVEVNEEAWIENMVKKS